MPDLPESSFHIRAATPEDIPAVFDLVRKLAEYERLTHIVSATPHDFHQALFGARPAAEALLAFLDRRAVGLALYFSNFSTFLGRSWLYLEDIFVEPEHRGQGIGKAFFRRLAQIGVERGCGRIEWNVLTWNQPSIEFYERLGAERLEEWRTYRLAGDALQKAAG